jgi:hypothetical protein
MKFYVIGAIFILFCLFSESNRDKLSMQIHGKKGETTSDLVIDLVIGSLMWPMTILILLNLL